MDDHHPRDPGPGRSGLRLRDRRRRLLPRHQRSDYGKLSGRRLDEAITGTRVEEDLRKENPGDFALWKSAKPGEPAWESPWGPGRPGWHIECSAMCLHHLGETVDIHGGGNDLVFPHHENEIAQSESFTGKPLARYWMHNGMLQLGGEKMSKSLGNLVTIDEFLRQHSPDALRMLIFTGHYRKPVLFNDETIGQRRAQRGAPARRPAASHRRRVHRRGRRDAAAGHRKRPRRVRRRHGRRLQHRRGAGRPVRAGPRAQQRPHRRRHRTLLLRRASARCASWPACWA